MQQQESQRRLLVHSAHEAIGVSSGLAALQACDLSRFVTSEGPRRRMRVCIAGRLPWGDAEAALPALESYLKRHCRTECVRIPRNGNGGLPAAESLEGFDCVLLLGQQITIAAARGASPRLRKYAERDLPPGDSAGGGFPAGPTIEIEVLPAAKGHPVLAGVEPFRSRAPLQYQPRIDENCSPLLLAVPADRVLSECSSAGGGLPSRPVAWTRCLDAARCFRTVLGRAEDFRNTSFLRLLGNALRWTQAGRPGE